MSGGLSILVIDDNKIRASIIEQGLHDAGHDKVILVHQMEGLVRQIADINPDVIVIDLENPNRDQLEHMFQVSRAVRRPIAMFVDKSDSHSIEAAVDAGVSAYIVDGLKHLAGRNADVIWREKHPLELHEAYGAVLIRHHDVLSNR